MYIFLKCGLCVCTFSRSLSRSLLTLVRTSDAAFALALDRLPQVFTIHTHTHTHTHKHTHTHTHIAKVDLNKMQA
jgi:hypothetical protein